MEYKLINKEIAQDFSLSTIEKILLTRGIKKEDISHYLNVDENDNVSPFLVKNVHQGVKMIIEHLKKGKIYIQVDSDCDGYTSAAVLINYLHDLLPRVVENNVVYGFHDGKKHGINLSLIPEDTTLVITPDSGSNDFDEHKYLTEHGIDVLVIDHHMAGYISPYACVINNQLSDYPTKSLSGVGMVYKVCQYMDSIWHLDRADHYLDLVALGLVADMMDQRDFETSYLIKTGLNNIQSPWFEQMIEDNQFSLKTKNITPIQAGFYIAPCINAITRMGKENEKEVLFESLLEWKAREEILSTKRGCKGQYETIVTQAIRNSKNAKNRQKIARDKAVARIEKIIQDNKLSDNKILTITLEETSEIEKNISGVIANELVNRFKRPVLILHQDFNELNEKVWTGSARGYEKSPIKDFKKFVQETNLPYLAEGHPNAFGFGIKESDLNSFIEITNKTLEGVDLDSTSYRVDFIYGEKDSKILEDIYDICDMKNLWGKNIEEPLIAIEGIHVDKDNIYLMSKDKSPTLKIALPNNISCIKFKSSEDEFNELNLDSNCAVVNLVGRCNLNTFNGITTPQIFIVDYEIVGYEKYYF